MALKRFSAVYTQGEERLVSASDDFTLFMWLPEKEKKPTGLFLLLLECMYIITFCLQPD
jgi:hypothetical protein